MSIYNQSDRRYEQTYDKPNILNKNNESLDNSPNRQSRLKLGSFNDLKSDYKYEHKSPILQSYQDSNKKTVEKEENNTPRYNKFRDNKIGQSQEFVDQLERQYERAQQDSLARLRLSEENGQRTIDSLKTQISSLKQQLSLNTEHHAQEVRRLHEKYRFELEQSMNSKENTIHSYENKCESIKRQLEDEIGRYNELREQGLASKLQHNAETAELKHVLKKTICELDELKHQHQNITAEQINQLHREKEDLKRTFDDSIIRLKDAHMRDIDELNMEIRRKTEMNIELENQLARQQKEAEDRFLRLKEDTDALHESLRSGRKLNELQMEENRRLSRTLEEQKRENNIIVKENSLFENEANRLRQDNDDLRASVIRLDRLVYGRAGKKETPQKR